METPEQVILSRIGVIEDIHAEYSRLRAALSFLQEQQLQAILCVGDIVDGDGNVDACCELLEQHRVVVVRGNHDQWFSANLLRDLPQATLPDDVSPFSRDYIGSLPIVKEFQTAAGKLLLCHGIGARDMGRVTPDDYGYAIESNFELQDLITSNHYRFMINGHTHQRMVRTFRNLMIINAGTLKRGCTPGLLTADFESGRIQFYNLKENGAVEESDGYELP